MTEFKRYENLNLDRSYIDVALNDYIGEDYSFSGPEKIEKNKYKYAIELQGKKYGLYIVYNQDETTTIYSETHDPVFLDLMSFIVEQVS